MVFDDLAAFGHDIKIAVAIVTAQPFDGRQPALDFGALVDCFTVAAAGAVAGIFGVAASSTEAPRSMMLSRAVGAAVQTGAAAMQAVAAMAA